MQIARRATAEAIGTFWLVFGGCGSAVIAASIADVGIGLLGVSLAFGLTVLTMGVPGVVLYAVLAFVIPADSDPGMY